MELRNEEPLGNEATPWVERETTIEASPDEVWEAITEEGRLSEWLAPEVELDPVEGGEIAVRDGDEERSGTVETVEEGERFSFTWQRPGEGESFVEFTVEAVPAGTRVVVVETPIGTGTQALAAPLRVRGRRDWDLRLGLLRGAVSLAPVA